MSRSILSRVVAIATMLSPALALAGAPVKESSHKNCAQCDCLKKVQYEQEVVNGSVYDARP